MTNPCDDCESSIRLGAIVRPVCTMCGCDECRRCPHGAEARAAEALAIIRDTVHNLPALPVIEFIADPADAPVERMVRALAFVFDNRIVAQEFRDHEAAFTLVAASRERHDVAQFLWHEIPGGLRAAAAEKIARDLARGRPGPPRARGPYPVVRR